MTDFPHPPSADDELLSAYLDGETTAEETARVVGDARLQARLREFEAAAALVGTPVEPASPAARDAAIGAALDAAHDGVPEDARVAPVVHLHDRRRTRWALASVAAVVLFVVIAASRVLQPADSGSTTALNQIESKAAQSSGAAAAEQPTADRAAPRGETDLGEFATTGELVSAARSLFATGPVVASAGTRAPDSSAFAGERASCVTDPGRGSVVFNGAATLRGQPVQVIVQEDGTGVRFLSIVDERCTVLSAQPL